MLNSVGAIQPTGRFNYIPQQTTFNTGIGLYDSGAIGNPYSAGMFGVGGFDYFSPTGMGGIGNPMTFNNNTYFDNMKQYQQFYNDYYINQQNMYRNQQLMVNAPMNSVQQAARDLKDKVNQNEQDQIMQAFNAYVNVVARAYGGDAADEDVKNQALALYAQMNGGIPLEEDLRMAGHGSMVQGIISGLTLGLYGRKSAEDNISDITGQPVGTEENIKKKAGGFLGGAATGAGVGAGVGAIFGVIGAAPGAIAGAIAGGLIGLFRS